LYLQTGYDQRFLGCQCFMNQRCLEALVRPGVSEAPILAKPILQQRVDKVRELLPHFRNHALYEWNLAPKTVKGYEECLLRTLNVWGDIGPEEITSKQILALKADLSAKGAGQTWTRNVLQAVRSFLRFCRLGLGIEALDPQAISVPRISRREVIYLTAEEVEQFLSAIPVFSDRGKVDLKWLTFRALVEVLLGTGMRISEALSIRRASLNIQTGEAKIIGKGNRERVIFFTPRALAWTKEYTNHRHDESEWLFAQRNGDAMAYDTVRFAFRYVRRRAGLVKRVTAHILRHTCATILLFNGCPIGHIKEILGHERLITTCQYYLGVDKKAAKDAHSKFLQF
jgi:integrase/recombinase XerD